MDLQCEMIDLDVDSSRQKPMFAEVSQADNEETKAELEADEMKGNTSNTGSTNNANIHTDGVENNIFDTIESYVDSPRQNLVFVDIFQADNEQTVVELKADEIKANKPNTVSKTVTNMCEDGVKDKVFEMVDSNVDSPGQKPMSVDMFYPDSEPPECLLETDEIEENTPNLNLLSQNTDIHANGAENSISEKPYGKDHCCSAIICNELAKKNMKMEQNSDKEHTYSSIAQNQNKKETGKRENMENMERNFLDHMFVTETAKTSIGLSETLKQTYAAESLPSADEKQSSAVKYFPMPVVQLTTPISPLVHRPVSSQRMGMILPIQTPLPTVPNQIEPVRVFANSAVKALLNYLPQHSLQSNIIPVALLPNRAHTAIQPMPVTVLPNQTQMSQFSAETKDMKKKKNVAKTSAGVSVCKSSSIGSYKTVPFGSSEALKAKLSGRGKTADETGQPCADEAAQNVVQENRVPEITAMLPLAVKVYKIQCVCCGNENHLININSNSLKKEGFPEILFRYGGITKARYKDSYICKECRAEVVMTHNRVKTFFKKCKRNAQKTGQLIVKKIPSLNENEYEQLRKKCISKTAVIKAQPKVVQNTQLNQAINTSVPGQSITSIPVFVSGLPKNTCDACTQTQGSKFCKLIPKDHWDTETPLREEVIFDQLLKEKVSVDHDYEQSTSEEQRADFMKKAEIEELKTNLYSEDKIEGVSLQSLILQYCGLNIQSSEFCKQLLLSQEMKNAFLAATLKDVSFTALRLQTRKEKLGYVSELRKKGHDSLSSFSWTVLFREFCDHFPYVAKALIVISNIPAEKLEGAIPRLGMIYGMLVQLRDTDLNRVQRLISKCLLENLVPKQVFRQLSRMGICLDYSNSYSFLQGGPRSHTSPFSIEELRKNKAARENRKKCNIKTSDKLRKRAAQFKFQDRNKGRDGYGSSSLVVPEVNDAEEEPPDKKQHFEASAGDELSIYKPRGREADWNTLTPSEQTSAVLCEKTGKVTLKRKKHILSVKTCEKEQSVNSWTPEDLVKCHIKYTSDWLSSCPYDNLDIIPVKYLPAEMSEEEESILGDLNELFDLDIDINNLGEEELGKTIENLTKTVEMLESDNIVHDETQETQMMYECAIDWLRVILQILIRQQSGLSYHREEAIQMVNAFVRCFGCRKERGAAAEKTMRVFTTKVTSTPALRVLKKDKNGREKVVAVAEVPIGIGADKRLFEKLAGELLLEIPYSLYPDCMFGLLFYKTSVVMTCLNITNAHIRKLQMNCPLTERHSATAVYTKLYDLLKANERLEVMRFMKRLSFGPKTSADIQETGQDSKKSHDLFQAKATVEAQEKQQTGVMMESSKTRVVVESSSQTEPRKLMTFNELMAREVIS